MATRRRESTSKVPFDVTAALTSIRQAVREFPRAAMFELADRGYRSVFHQLVGCIISIRTRDEVSLPTALRLFEHAPTPKDLAQLEPDQIDRLIQPATFHEAKARQIQFIAKQAVEAFGGDLPADVEVLTSLPGVGPKCAHLALGIASGQQRISVDIHVHRVTNRWGYVRAPTPERTMAELERRLPRRHWIELNSLLVPSASTSAPGGCRTALPVRCWTC